MKLRWYQEQAVAAVWDYLRNEKGSPCVVLPTGSGKTPVIAEMCRQVLEWGGRVVVLAHVKELLAQAADKLRRFVNPDDIGLYSAGLNERTTDKPIVVAGIQSVYKRAAELGERQLIIVDEAHLIPPQGAGRYRRFLEEARKISPDARLVGLTATPYRLGSGWIVNDRISEEQRKEENGAYDRLLDTIVYDVPVNRLISDGTLSAVVSRNASRRPDFSKVHVVRGDYDEKEIEKVLARKGVLERASREIVDETIDRRKVLVFCASRKSARRCAELLREYSEDFDAAVVDGNTPSGDRADLLRRFKSETGDETLIGRDKPLKFICNVGVLTTGFDAPNVDCIALLRPTQSLTLYHQMIGRGLRRAPDKANCLVLDYGGNVERLGPIDVPDPDALVRAPSEPKPWRECPKCRSVVARTYAACPICGEQLVMKRPPSDPNAKLQDSASGKAILSDQEDAPDEEKIEREYEVLKVEYAVHFKKNAEEGKPPTMRVSYHFSSFRYPISEWLCVEHTGFPRRKFEKWWKSKSAVPPPTSVEEAVAYAQQGALATPKRIKTVGKLGERFPSVVWLESTPIPDFDPASVKFDDGADDYFDDGFPEFEKFESAEDSDDDREHFCSSCSHWSPDGESMTGGYCKLKECDRALCDPICEAYDYINKDEYIPF